MKLKNKQTGEIGNLALNINPNRESYSVLSTENGDTVCGNLVIADYNSLAELNKEWEDYEEAKKGVKHIEAPVTENDNTILIEYYTKEEAELAVEKLKAWKRLKDKGFRFEWWISKPEGNEIDFYLDEFEWSGQVTDDLNLLFGGKE